MKFCLKYYHQRAKKICEVHFKSFEAFANPSHKSSLRSKNGWRRRYGFDFWTLFCTSLYSSGTPYSLTCNDVFSREWAIVCLCGLHANTFLTHAIWILSFIWPVKIGIIFCFLLSKRFTEPIFKPRAAVS